MLVPVVNDEPVNRVFIYPPTLNQRLDEPIGVGPVQRPSYLAVGQGADVAVDALGAGQVPEAFEDAYRVGTADPEGVGKVVELGVGVAGTFHE
jgi:hypothetical protein